MQPGPLLVDLQPFKIVPPVRQITEVGRFGILFSPPSECRIDMECGRNVPQLAAHLTSQEVLAAEYTVAANGCEVAMGTQQRTELSAIPNEDEQEARNIRRLQLMISMVMSVIGQDENLTIEEASELVAGAKRAALAMFPDKELAYDIIYKPRLQRLMNERFRLQ